MKKRTLLSLVLFLASASTVAFGQNKGEKKAPGPPSEAEMAAMMSKWKEAGTPGAAHKYLDQFVGEWNIAVKMWMGPGAPPLESTATSSVRWIMGGRFLLEESKGLIMNMPFEGMGVTGYDNFNKQYVSSWLDNMNTAMYSSQGRLEGDKLVFWGKMDEPMTGERGKPVRYENRVISKDQHVFQIFDLAGTKNEFKALEMVYTRK